MNQSRKTETLETIPEAFSYLIFNKGIKNIHRRGFTASSASCVENWLSTCRTLPLHPYLCHTLKIPKWVINLNIKIEVFKPQQEKASKNIEVTGVGKDFLKEVQIYKK